MELPGKVWWVWHHGMDMKMWRLSVAKRYNECNMNLPSKGWWMWHQGMDMKMWKLSVAEKATKKYNELTHEGTKQYLKHDCKSLPKQCIENVHKISHSKKKTNKL